MILLSSAMRIRRGWVLPRLGSGVYVFEQDGFGALELVAGGEGQAMAGGGMPLKFCMAANGDDGIVLKGDGEKVGQISGDITRVSLDEICSSRSVVGNVLGGEESFWAAAEMNRPMVELHKDIPLESNSSDGGAFGTSVTDDIGVAIKVSGDFSGVPGKLLEAFAGDVGSFTKNSEPFKGPSVAVCSHHTSPPIFLASPLATNKPSPRPSNRRVIVVSSLAKALNRFGRNSLLIPFPVSLILKTT